MRGWLKHYLGEIQLPLPQERPTDPLCYACAFMILASLVLGGVSRIGFLSDTILALLSIPLLAWGIWRLFDIELSRQMRGALWFCVALVAIPLFQLVPLPGWLWTLLPHRQISAESFALMRESVPWMPTSVSPEATWLSAISLLPPLSLFVGIVLLGYRDRRWLSLVIIAVGVISAFLGVLQVAQGPSSPLRFYQFTNPTEAVGFFANRNHFAALVNVLVVLTAAWAIQAGTAAGSALKRREFDTLPIIAAVACFAIFVLLLAAQAMARSRAGIGLAMVALLAAFSLAIADRRGATGEASTTNRLFFAAIALAVLLIVQLALYRILERFEVDPFEDERFNYVVNTLKAAMAYLPVGSGVGTFVPVYQLFEPPQDFHVNAHLNRAHNEFVEAWLETGILGLVLMGWFVAWFGRKALEIWRNVANPADAIDRSLARSATVIIPLIGAHAFFDYPLRTSAMMAMVAFACALLITPPASALLRQPILTPQARRARRSEMAAKPVPALAISPLPNAVTNSPQALPAPTRGERWGTEIQWPDEWRSLSESPDAQSEPPKRP